MGPEVEALVDRAIESVVLSIDIFNRPVDIARPESTLILLDRGLELLLKACILDASVTIADHDKPHQMIGFEKCVSICLSNNDVACIDEDTAITLRTINGLRDCAQHHILHISEQLLYANVQAGVTVFAQILEDTFQIKMSERVPERVLPISVLPPRDLLTLVDFEIDEIRRALRTEDPIKVVEGRSQLRAIAAMEAAAQGEGSVDVDLAELEAELMGAGRDWRTIFPGVASISMSTEGNGLNVSIHITKTQGEPVRLVAKDSPEAAKAALVAVHKVAETSFYSLGFNDLAARTTPIGVSRGKLPAVIAHLKLKQDDSMFKRFQFGKLPVERYSKKALETLLTEIPKLEVPAVWAAYRKSLKKRS